MKKIEYSYSKTIEFAKHKTGLYDIDTFSRDWDNPESNRGVIEKRCRIVKLNEEKVLQIIIPKNSLSEGGSFWRLKLPDDLTEVTLEYDIMFGNNFNFVRGGKMPGLGGGTCPGGGSKDKNGFSARLMWRVINFHNKHLIKDPYKAYLVQYTYYPDKDESKKWGEDLVYKYRNKRIFVKSIKWYTITMKIKLSKNKAKKDEIIAWVNNKKVLNKRLYLRKNNDYGINEVMFSLFFGGEEPSWATKKKEKIYFKRFVIKGR